MEWGATQDTPRDRGDGKVARQAPHPGTCAPLSLWVGWGLSRRCVPTLSHPVPVGPPVLHSGLQNKGDAGGAGGPCAPGGLWA